jgi:hypothetical protein
MALVPPSGTHVNPDSYAFAQVNGANLINPSIVPAANEAAASLNLNNGATPATYVEHYMVKTSGGGLSANHYQAFLYGASVGGNNIGQIFDAYGLGNNWAALSMNRGNPLDAARMGSFTGTGAVVNVAVPSISANSQVRVAFVGGALPAAAPVIVVTANVGFSHNAAAGAIYQYEVVG